MDNALESGNLENQGESVQGAGQEDKSSQQQGEPADWKTQAKYFQSEKDKLHVENQKLKEYEKVGKFLESRPDITKAVASMVQGGQPEQPQRIALDKDEFDPWEAYNDPSSKSYQFRQQELQESINGAVQQQVGQQIGGMQRQIGMDKLQGELASRGLTSEDINSFMEFAEKNPAEYGVEGAINMWRSVTGQEPVENNNENPFDVIRQNQGVPQQAGVLSGEQPVRKSEKDSMWDSIVKAGSRTRVL